MSKPIFPKAIVAHVVGMVTKAANDVVEPLALGLGAWACVRHLAPQVGETVDELGCQILPSRSSFLRASTQRVNVAESSACRKRPTSQGACLRRTEPGGKPRASMRLAQSLGGRAGLWSSAHGSPTRQGAAEPRRRGPIELAKAGSRIRDPEEALKH